MDCSHVEEDNNQVPLDERPEIIVTGGQRPTSDPRQGRTGLVRLNLWRPPERVPVRRNHKMSYDNSYAERVRRQILTPRPYNDSR